MTDNSGIGILEGGDCGWLWPCSLVSTPNQYVQFRHEFVLPKPIGSARICVSCDSNYALWVNGDFVDCGQYHDFPEHKTCDILEIHGLRQGRNVLAVLVYHQGEGSFQYIKGSPGLIYELRAGEVTISSDKHTLYRVDSHYRSGPIDKITMQLGYTFDYDANGSDDWRSLDYIPGGDWSHPSDDDIVPVQERPLKDVRPVKKLEFGQRTQLRIAAQGLFARKLAGEASIAELVQSDYLSATRPIEVLEILDEGAIRLKRDSVKNADGVYLVLDTHREEVGLLDLDIEAAAGTTIDIAWGEHLDDLRVRAHVGARNFACRYVCKEGRQRFTHYFARLAGRYLQLHVSKMADDVTIHYAGLIPVWYPVQRGHSVALADKLHEKIYEMCVRTLHLCMHEHYEDCPWREQALYAMDMRNQALAGYHCFEEYDFPAASLDLLALSIKDDGFLEMCAPAEIPITLPVFTLAWILAVDDHYRYSGNLDALRRWYPIMTTIIEKRAASISDGLLPSPCGERYWHFYDWADGLDGCDGECTSYPVLTDSRYDAPLNIFYILALDAAAKLAGILDDAGTKTHYQSLADSLREQVHLRFWDASDGSYLTYSGATARLHRSELVQALAVLAEVCTEDVAVDLRKRLAAKDNKLVKTTLSYSFYKFEALLGDVEEYRKTVFRMIEDDWAYMLSKGATSFWETLKGSSDFDDAGSLCHGWSGIPVYFYHAYTHQ